MFNSFYNLIFCVDPFYDTIKIVPYVITAVLGTWCIYSIPWDLLKGKFAKLLEYTGNHTLFILVWHILSFKIVMLIRFFIDGSPKEKLAEFPSFTQGISDIWFIVYTIAGVGLPLIVYYGYEKAMNIVKPFFIHK